jgi:polyketide cyclase/dehydrase/lipid transport protein
VAKVTYTVKSDLPPQVVWDALTEFGPRRAELWPDLSPSYKARERGEGYAVVRESTDSIGIWVVERYEWSYPVITAIAQESNVVHQGGIWRMEVAPGGNGGSVLTIHMDRRAKGFVGHLIHAVFQVTNGRFLAARTQKMLSNIRRA